MMEINIGDKVRFLNSVGGGKVTGFGKGGIVMVEDEDGFEVPMLKSEVVVVPTEERSTKAFIAKPTPVAPKPVAAPVVKTVLPAAPEEAEEEESLEARVLRLEMTVRKLQRRLERLEDAKALREKVKAATMEQREQKRQQKDDLIEVDLHIGELLDTTAGMSAADMKDYQLGVFRKTMDEHLKDKGRRIVFIHGNGEGVLRKALIAELRRSYKSCEYQDASFQQYGFGATMVIIH